MGKRLRGFVVAGTLLRSHHEQYLSTCLFSANCNTNLKLKAEASVHPFHETQLELGAIPGGMCRRRSPLNLRLMIHEAFALGPLLLFALGTIGEATWTHKKFGAMLGQVTRSPRQRNVDRLREAMAMQKEWFLSRDGDGKNIAAEKYRRETSKR
jgi:hypothetical protein